MKRHNRDNYYIVGEGTVTTDAKGKPYTNPTPGDVPEVRKFRFSRLGPKGPVFDRPVVSGLAEAMTAEAGPDSSGPAVPAGFTYLGQFIDHDLTMDRTAKALGENVTVAELLQGRSPALDLDCLYGRGPQDAEDNKFYTDGVRFKVGRTAPSPDLGNAGATLPALDGYDLPRVGQGSTKLARRAALIADHRNDENLIVAQTHLAMLRFHNRVVEHIAASTPSTDLFSKARELVVKHYQWVIKTDFLPRIVDPIIVKNVFTNGRRFFEKDATPEHMPTMPIEFSVAAYRLGHSMIRGAYNWNRIFRFGGVTPATLPLLFQFTGTSGILSPDGELNDRESGSFEQLPSNWSVDFRRLYDFTEAGRDDLSAPDGVGVAKLIDTLLVDPLKTLPHGSIGGSAATPPEELNLAFRNLQRANMVSLATGQQMAALMGVEALTPAQITAKLPTSLKSVGTSTPLWYYVLREAELNGGKLAGVGGRIVAETFHRAMEGSAHSIVRDPSFRPTALAANPGDRFNMTDLLLFAFDGRADLLNPLGD